MEPARTFFFMNLEDIMTFEKMVAVIMAEYESDGRREQVLSNTKSLNLKDHMKKEDITDGQKILTIIINIIHKLKIQWTP